MSWLRNIGPSEDERLAEHVRRVEVEQQMRLERHRTHGLKDEEPKPDPALIRRIIHGDPLKHCWRI